MTVGPAGSRWRNATCTGGSPPQLRREAGATGRGKQTLELPLRASVRAGATRALVDRLGAGRQPFDTRPLDFEADEHHAAALGPVDLADGVAMQVRARPSVSAGNVESLEALDLRAGDLVLDRLVARLV